MWASEIMWREVDVKVLRCVARLWIWGGGIAVSVMYRVLDHGEVDVILCGLALKSPGLPIPRWRVGKDC